MSAPRRKGSLREMRVELGFTTKKNNEKVKSSAHITSFLVKITYFSEIQAKIRDILVKFWGKRFQKRKSPQKRTG